MLTASEKVEPGPFWPSVRAPDRALSMSQVEQTVRKQITDVKLWWLYSNTWNYLTVCKKELRFTWKCYQQKVFTNYIYIYIFNIYVWRRFGIKWPTMVDIP